MKDLDRGLVSIVVGIVVVAVVALVVALRVPEATYVDDSAPGGVAYNYLLAMQKKDYSQAYLYLSPTLPGYPSTVEQFVDDTTTRIWSPDDSQSLKVEDVSVTGDRAVVTISQTSFYAGGLFESSQMTNQHTVRLGREERGWRLLSSDISWDPCWSDTDRCDDDGARGVIEP
jgi:hypothetical protein